MPREYVWEIPEKRIKITVEESSPTVEEAVEALRREKDILESIRHLARISAPDVRDALSGQDTDLEKFWINHLPHVDVLARRLISGGISGEIIFYESASALQSEPRGNINPRLAKDMAGFLADKIFEHAQNSLPQAA